MRHSCAPFAPLSDVLGRAGDRRMYAHACRCRGTHAVDYGVGLLNLAMRSAVQLLKASSDCFCTLFVSCFRFVCRILSLLLVERDRSQPCCRAQGNGVDRGRQEGWKCNATSCSIYFFLVVVVVVGKLRRLRVTRHFTHGSIAHVPLCHCACTAWRVPASQPTR